MITNIAIGVMVGSIIIKDWPFKKLDRLEVVFMAGIIAAIWSV